MASPCSATDFSDEVEDVIGPFRKKVADGLDGFAPGGVNDVRCAESPCHRNVECLLLTTLWPKPMSMAA
jgi:hypothetical protein